jgi:hypothetical protein
MYWPKVITSTLEARSAIRGIIKGLEKDTSIWFFSAPRKKMTQTSQGAYDTILILTNTKHHACLGNFDALLLRAFKNAKGLPEVRSAVTHEGSHLLCGLYIMGVHVETRLCN